MFSSKALFICAAVLTAPACSGCAVPHFDVPVDTAGQPTVATIVQRIQCELRDIVRDDPPNTGDAFHRNFLMDGDYDVAVSLSLEVNDTGGLAPTLSYMHPLSKVASFMFGGTATLSESRDHNFTENVQLSVRRIYTEWKKGINRHDCPPADTNLAGTLGIKEFVAMAALTPQLAEDRPPPTPTDKNPAPKTAFGGSIQFLVTKSVTALGPTWSLVHFKGPGGLGSLSEVNTDKITLAFARGTNAGKPLEPHPLNPYAQLFLQQLLTSSINSQLLILQNSLPVLQNLVR
jgi:hypothetical protein